MSNNGRHDSEKLALQRYLTGDITTQELHQALSRVARFNISSEGISSIVFHSHLTCEVEVDVSHVRNRLKDYLRGKVSDEELAQWATHLVLIESYVTPAWEEELEVERYEPMWNILQQLSTPAIDGEITSRRIDEYLRVLGAI